MVSLGKKSAFICHIRGVRNYIFAITYGIINLKVFKFQIIIEKYLKHFNKFRL